MLRKMPSTRPVDFRVTRVLREVPLFRQCSDHEFTAIAGFSEYLNVAAETTLFKEGEQAEAIYFVSEGLVELVRTSGTGKDKVVELIGSGESLAEAVVFSGRPYPVSASTLMDTSLIRINADPFRRFLQQHPGVSWRMLSALSLRLHRLVGQISSLSLLTAEQRVADYLVKNLDKTAPERPVRKIPQRRRELASHLNLTPETLCRVLAVFRGRGWIELPTSSSVIVKAADALAGLSRGRETRAGKRSGPAK
jgi:CRP-like cAMP-binding protein